jgi:hypothetical protein
MRGAVSAEKALRLPAGANQSERLSAFSQMRCPDSSEIRSEQVGQ